MGGRQFVLDDGTTANVPEESLDKWMQRMDSRGIKFRSAETDADVASTMTVGEPEVIKSEKPLGRTLDMAEVRETTPEAPSGSDWLRGLLGGSEDPTGFSTQASTMQPTEYGSAPRAIGSMVAGGVHGYTAGLDRAAGQAFDVAAPVREWSVDAERDNPMLFAMGDFVGSVASPVNKIAAAARFIKPGVGRVAGELGEQMAIGAVEDATRQYGDTGHAEAPSGWVAGLTGALSLPGALVSNAAAKSAARQATPEARALRAQDADNEFLRSAGYDDKAIDELRAQPEKYGDVLSEIKRLADERGGTYTIPQMAASVQRASDEAGFAKNAAAEAMAQGGATVDPMDIADKLRADVRERSPAAQYGAPLSSDYVAGGDAIADRYATQGMGIPGGRIMEPVQRVPAVPDRPPAPPPPIPPSAPAPAPDPIGALATQSPSSAPYYYHTTPAENLPLIQAHGLQPRAAQSTPGYSPYANSSSADRPDALWLADETGRDTWLSNLAEETMVDRDADVAKFVSLRTRANPGTANPKLAEYIRTQGIPPNELEVTPPFDVQWSEHSGARVPDDQWSSLATSQTSASSPTPAPASAFGSLLGTSPESSAFGALGASPAPIAGDPIAALAAQSAPPPVAAQALPPPSLPAVNQLPPPAADPDAWMRGLGAQAPLPDPMADLGPAPVPFNAYLDELDKAGQPIKPELAKPEDAFARERYAAINHAMDLGAERADPELATQWADAKKHQGRLNLIRDQAASARHDAPPFFEGRNSALGTALGSLGGGLAYSLGAGALGASGLGALGAGAGMAINHWYQPRKHSIQARWLSGDTADKMERLSEKARLPVGAAGAAVRDGFRAPPPPAADERDPNGPTSSVGFPPGMTLGRDTTSAMQANPSAFMNWADDYNKSRTDDARAATTERLVRTDPIFAANVYEPLIQRSNA